MRATVSASGWACALAAGVLAFCLGRTLTHLGSPEPRLEIAPPCLDLGIVAIGIPVQREFILRNSGAQRLLITGIKSTCRCTIPTLAKTVLAPGESERVVVVFTADGAGPKLQQVLIEANDPARNHLWTLKATAVAPALPSYK